MPIEEDRITFDTGIFEEVTKGVDADILGASDVEGRARLMLEKAVESKNCRPVVEAAMELGSPLPDDSTGLACGGWENNERVPVGELAEGDDRVTAREEAEEVTASVEGEKASVASESSEEEGNNGALGVEVAESGCESDVNAAVELGCPSLAGTIELVCNGCWSDDVDNKELDTVDAMADDVNNHDGVTGMTVKPPKSSSSSMPSFRKAVGALRAGEVADTICSTVNPRFVDAACRVSARERAIGPAEHDQTKITNTAK